jgi:hypothetical protein
MGHCASREEKDQKKLNRRIEDQIRKDQSMSLRIIKLLLLGESVNPSPLFSLISGHLFQVRARVAKARF